MSRSKKRGRSPSSNASGNGQGRLPEGAVSAKAARTSEASREPKPVPRDFGVNLYPGVLRSLGVSALAATQPALIVGALLFIFAVWLVLLAIGVRAYPAEMMNLFGMPPFAAQFDGSVGTSIYGSQMGLLAALGLTVFRAGFFSVLIGVMDESLEFGKVTSVGPLRGLQAFPAVLACEYVALVATLFGGSVGTILGQAAGQILFLLVPIAIMFFLAMPLIAAVVGGFGTRESLRRGVQASRLPGWSRYLLLCVLYFMVFATLPQLLASQLSIITANPGFATWVVVLGAAFLHIVFVGALIQNFRAVAPYLPLIPRPRGGTAAARSRGKR